MYFSIIVVDKSSATKQEFTILWFLSYIYIYILCIYNSISICGFQILNQPDIQTLWGEKLREGGRKFVPNFSVKTKTSIPSVITYDHGNFEKNRENPKKF